MKISNFKSDVLPGTSPSYGVNSLAAYAVAVCYIYAAQNPLITQFADFLHLGRSQLCVAASFAVLNTALLLAILHVVFLTSGFQVSRIKARGIVALVKHAELWGNLSNGDSVSVAVDVLAFILSQIYRAVAFVVLPKRPYQTVVADVIRYRRSDVIRQRSFRRMAWVVHLAGAY